MDSASLLGYVPFKHGLKFGPGEERNFSGLQPIEKFTDYLGKIRDGYGIFVEDPDSPSLNSLLEQIKLMSIPSFVAGSYHIRANTSVKNQTKEMQDFVTYSITGIDKSLCGVRGSKGANVLEPVLEPQQEEQIQDLSTQWLDKLNSVWA